MGTRTRLRAGFAVAVRIPIIAAMAAHRRERAPVEHAGQWAKIPVCRQRHGDGSFWCL
jgi:hypothetical protein